MNQRQAIEKIQAIRNGSGIDRTQFPDSMKGEVPKTKWNDVLFTLGLEYGYLMALMDVYELTQSDIE